jgi:hypothetical protein
MSGVRALAALAFTASILLEARVMTAPGQEQTARARVGETLRIGGTNASLTFVRVERDSRCPKGARCIRAGEAVVIFSLREEDGAVSTLTLEVPPGGGASQSFHGYRVQVVGLDPQAETDVEIAPSDYVAAIGVQKQ